MSKFYLIGSAALAAVIHIVWGWPYSVLGAVVAGVLVKTRPVLAGSIALGVSWGGFILYNFWIAGPETVSMTGVMAALIGDLPAFVTVLITLGIALVLGAAGGWIGALLGAKKSNS